MSFSARTSDLGVSLTPADRRVIAYLTDNRERALYSSAADIAQAVRASDATVIRTVRKLGYSGLDALRQALADDLRRDLTLSDRMANELRQSEDGTALTGAAATLRVGLDAIEAIDGRTVDELIRILVDARCIHVFGIGPSGFVAGYFAAQLARLGFEARALTQTGLQCADDLIRMKPGDAVAALAYDRPYPEVTALFDRAVQQNLSSILITSTGPRLPDRRASVTLRVPRGRAEGFGLHAGTMALLEGMLIACAGAKPDKSRDALDTLNAIRRDLSGDGMGL
ncbi:MurR/RpiR family transcriptional regulator [Rhodospirillaceae bacterium KN72]|uniref:MurR/RpiR family transcriptional regulator n=1 Tax=Pacificispira spongiicola TaxID=2729598 RepID=A0A7Y0HFI3_9PROT|nr:MurR/RpiR family transcriptional regulator [Pacificispira spongiicola]NMM45890.1 MurR/RpiR family transcriptional regulator [Pacificispira spongiicola]